MWYLSINKNFAIYFYVFSHRPTPSTAPCI